MSAKEEPAALPLKNLTRYKPASPMELWVIVWPLIISALSGNLMLFMDRVLLAQYSVQSMNAVAAAGMSALVFIFGMVAIVGIAEVFVGRYNGAQNFDKVAEPVWQMLILSMASVAVFWPIAIWCSDFCVAEELRDEGSIYFKIVMIGGPLLPMFTSLAAFFSGRGKTKVITIAAVIGNVVNCVLAYLLIFGISGVLPPLGTKGAAFATVFSQFLQVIILASVFLNRSNRRMFHTNRCRFAKATMMQCIRVGYPNALGHLAEMSAWSVLFYNTAGMGSDYITILTLGQSLYLLFAFFTEGLQKGVIAIASNLIGANKKPMLHKLLYSSFKLHCIIIAFLTIPLLICPDWVLTLFALSGEVEGGTVSMLDQYRTCQYIWGYCIFDGFLWVFAGLLTALEDTMFIMLTNSMSAMLLGVLPIYISIVWFAAPARWIWGCLDIYAVFVLISLAWRYKNMMQPYMLGPEAAEHKAVRIKAGT